MLHNVAGVRRKKKEKVLYSFYRKFWILIQVHTLIISFDHDSREGFLFSPNIAKSAFKKSINCLAVLPERPL